MRSHLTLLATAVVAFAACGPDAGTEGPSAQDRMLAADFAEVYRVGGRDAPDWAQFSRSGPVGFDGAGNLHILDPFASRVVVVDPEGRLVRTIAYADSSAYAIRVVVPGGPEVDVLLRPIPPQGVTDRPPLGGD